MRPRTRGLVAALMPLALVSGSVVLASGPAAAADSDFDAVRAVVYDQLTGGDAVDPADPDQANRIETYAEAGQKAWDALIKDPDRTQLWEDLRSDGPGAGSDFIQFNYQRILDMANALEIRGSSLYQDPQLLADTLSALDFIHATWYNPQIATYGNWYGWELGSPLTLTRIVTLLYDDISEQQRDDWMGTIAHFNPTISFPSGANRTWDAQIFILRGILTRDEAAVTTGTDALPVLMQYQTALNGDGLYPDGSAIGHRYFADTLGYSFSLTRDLSFMLAWLKGSPWEVTDPSVKNLVRWAFDSYVPLVFRSELPPSLAGRAYARGADERIDYGVNVTGMVLQIAEIAEPDEAKLLRGYVKEWILSSSPPGRFYSLASLPSIAMAKAVVEDDSIPRAGDKDLYKQFPLMDRVVSQKPDYQFSVAMSSTRIANYESINTENLKGWYTGSGMTSLYNGDLDQYKDNYWPTVDSSRIPGTTVLEGTSARASALGAPFAGGTDIDGRWGVSGMEFTTPGEYRPQNTPIAPDRTLTGKKSWFMFDDEIVALGSGITSTDGIPVETIVDNRKLDAEGDNAIVVDGDVKPTEPGWTEQLPGTQWLNVAGDVPDSEVGYYFPGGTDLTVMRDKRSGAWSDIQKVSPWNDPTVHTNTYATFFAGHGTNPTDASYGYVVLPNLDPEQTAAYAESPGITVLTQTPTVHAVRDDDLHATGANFFADEGGSVVVDDQAVVSTDAAASVMMREHDYLLDVSISDPTLTGDTVEVEIDRPTRNTASPDERVTVTQYAPTTKLLVDVSGTRGAAAKVTLSLTGDQAEPEVPDAPVPTLDVVDPLNDWSIASAHSAGWKLDTANSQLVAGDTSRAARIAETVETIDYSVPAAQTVTANVFTYGPADKVELLASPDGQTWSAVAGAFSAPIPGTTGGWAQRTYAPNEDLPAGTNHVRVRVDSGSRVWSPQIGEVRIAIRTALVSFDSTGGSPVVSQAVRLGGTATEPTPPTRQGYEFAGWNTRADGGDQWDFANDPVGADITLYARWTEPDLDVPPGDGATAAPAAGRLSSDNGRDGLHDGDYRVTMNLWYGQNASVFKLYENGMPVGTVQLDPRTPRAQTASVDLDGRPNGVYEYTGVLVNSKGTTEVTPLTVEVTDALPAVPALRHDNWDRDGDYTITANLWWGTNATSYRLFEDGVEIDSGSLDAATPRAQSRTFAVEGAAPGEHIYCVYFANAAGETSSRDLRVTVE